MAAHRANTYPLHDRPLPPPPFERPSEDSIRVIQDTSFSLPSLKRLKEKCDRLRRWPMLIYDRFIERIGLNEHVNPQNNTVVWSITSFLLFVLFCSLAVVFPVRSMRVAVLVLGISLFIILSIKLLHDFKTKREQAPSFLHLCEGRERAQEVLRMALTSGQARTATFEI